MHHILSQESLKGWLFFFFFEILIFPIIDGVNVIYLSIALFVVAGFILFIYLFIDSLLLLFQKPRLLCDALPAEFSGTGLCCYSAPSKLVKE